MIKKVFRFYYDGFQEHDLGRKLWGIILIKLFIMFAILQYFLLSGFS